MRDVLEMVAKIGRVIMFQVADNTGTEVDVLPVYPLDINWIDRGLYGDSDTLTIRSGDRPTFLIDLAKLCFLV